MSTTLIIITSIPVSENDFWSTEGLTQHFVIMYYVTQYNLYMQLSLDKTARR